MSEQPSTYKAADIERAQINLAHAGLLVVPDYKAQKYFADTNNNNLEDRFEQRIAQDKRVLEKYHVANDSSKSIGRRIRAFFGATSKAGRWGKVVKDFILLLTPYSQRIQSVTEFVTERFIKPKQNDTTMENENIFQKIVRYLGQPSTRTAITVLVTLITGWFSFDLNPDVFLSSFIGIITGLSGVYAGFRSLHDLFRDEENPAKKQQRSF